MAWIEVSRIDLVATGELKVAMLADPVNIVMVSLDPTRVFVEGDITSDIFFVGLVGCSFFV